MADDNSQENTDHKSLTRRERRRLARQQEKEKEKKGDSSKWIWWLIAVAIIVGVIFFVFRNYTKPLPGEEVKDLGREHVTDIAGIEYSSNPPTSGSHFTVWAKPGVYDRLISDGHFIHSMEHGYVIVYYDCTKPLSTGYRLPATEVLAHNEPAKDSTDSGQLLKHLKFKPKEGESWITPQNQPEIEVELPEEFKSESCKNLVQKLTEFTKVADRVIVAPRINMDTPIALTAWARILKLQNVDDAKIEEFIKAYHNRGPEKTME